MHKSALATDSVNLVSKIYGFQKIDGVVPGIKGQRAFPTPDLKTTDPFIMLDQIGPEKLPTDFKVNGALHPHRGFETITMMFEGNMAHKDSLGNEAMLNSGSIQVMNAGKGISHGGDMSADEKTSRFHEVQLWVNSPAKFKMSDPGVNTFTASEIPVTRQKNSRNEELQIRVLAGNATGLSGPARTFADISVLHVIAKGEHRVTLPIPDGHETAFLYALEGESVMIGNKYVPEFYTAGLDKTFTSVNVEVTNAQFLWLTGKPIGEPVVMGGPFVMNTQAEIDQAMMDYKQGLFG